MVVEYQDHRVKPAQLLTASANALHQAFIAATRVEAKRRFRELSDGKRVPLVELALEDDSILRLTLELDHRHHTGGLNFSGFRRILGLLLYRVGERLQQDQPDLGLMNDEAGRRLLFHIPAVEAHGETMNILVLGMDLTVPGLAMLQLLYMDPSQYQRSDREAAD